MSGNGGPPRRSSRDRERQRVAAREARLEERRRERVRAAADYCSDILADGWADSVAERAADYVSPEIWERLFSRRKNQCKALARLAQRVIAVKEELHDWIGGLVAWVLALLGVGATGREFAGELARNIPIVPVDAKIVAVARGLQVSGVTLCIFRSEDITSCQCFIDLALEETKSRVKKILVAAMDDWAKLVIYSPKTT